MMQVTKRAEDKQFEYVEDFAEEIVERVSLQEEPFVEVIGGYDEIRSLLKELMVYENTELTNVELFSEEFNGYNSEYLLDIWQEDEMIFVACEPAKRDGNYFNFEADEMYILNNCSSKILSHCESDVMYYVTVGEFEDDDEFDLDKFSDDSGIHIEYSCDKDNDLHGFTVSASDNGSYHSYSFYTNKNTLTKKEIREMLDDFLF